MSQEERRNADLVALNLHQRKTISPSQISALSSGRAQLELEICESKRQVQNKMKMCQFRFGEMEQFKLKFQMDLGRLFRGEGDCHEMKPIDD